MARNPVVHTDWLGRATYGGATADDYSAAWHRAFPGRWESGELDPGSWCQDDCGRHWWVTDTPAFDRQWWLSQGVRPPKRFGTYDHFTWKDYGGGLRKGVYDPDNIHPRDRRGVPLTQSLGPGESISFTVEEAPGDE